MSKQLQIEGQILKRISPNDPDFFLRKIRRLESQNVLQQEQIAKLRIRLRRAQEFQLKNELLIAQLVSSKTQFSQQSASFMELRTEFQKLKTSTLQKNVYKQNFEEQRKQMSEKILKLSDQLQELKVKHIKEVQEKQELFANQIKQMKEQLKNDYQERIEEKQFEIRQLQRKLHQKQSVEHVIHLRVQKVRKQKDQQIRRLTIVIDQLKDRHTTALKEKNNQIDKLKQKFEKLINFQVENIKKNLQDQDTLFTIQLNGLREIIQIKNNQIVNLLQQSKIQSQSHHKQSAQLRRQTSLLKEKIYTIQEQNLNQIVNLKERLTKIHSLQLKQQQQRNKKINGSTQEERNTVKAQLARVVKTVSADKQQFERALAEHNDKIREYEQRVNELMERIKQSGHTNSNQLKDLHKSFNMIQEEKQTQHQDYANNIAFMTQQITKLTNNCDVKNVQIQKLMDEIIASKKNYQERIKDIDQRLKNEKKQKQNIITQEREERQKMGQLLMTKELQFKNNERQLTRDKQKLERQNNKMKFLVEELQKDVERANKYAKQLDQNLKVEYKRQQGLLLQGDGSKRQWNSQLAEQKIQLQALKEIQVQHIKKKYQLQHNRILQENQKMKNQLLKKSIAYQQLQGQYRKLDHSNKHFQKNQKEKIIQYEKTMATLNNQINLTQQLYKTFLDVSSKKK